MNCSYVLIAIIGFIISMGLVVLLCVKHDVALIKESVERAHDALSTLRVIGNKNNTILDWFLSREGLKVDYNHRDWGWTITSLEDKKSMYRCLQDRDERRRNELAEALYKASITAMREFAEEQEKKQKKGGKKK